MPFPSDFHIKSKKSDFLILVALLVLSILFFHVISSFPRRAHHHTSPSFTENLQSPSHFLFCAVLVLIVFSPIWVYRRKVPKEIHLDSENRILRIVSKRHKKSLELSLDRISYFYESHALYSNLEIYLTVETSRGHIIKPLTRTIIVPSIGMKLNGSTLRQLVSCLKKNGVEVNPNAKPRTFWDIIAN